MKRTRHIPLLLLLAMGLVLLPAPLEAACSAISHPDLDPCETCLADVCDDAACGGKQDHAGDDCCETGCQHCSLPCCAGIAMIFAASPAAASAAPSDGRPVAAAPRAPWVDADPLYHPPRA